MVKEISDDPIFSKDWVLTKQMRASSGSTMDCIAEGFERGNNKEFVYFLGIALGSCGEVRSQGYRALDYGYINQEKLDQLLSLSIRVSITIRALLNYLLKSENKGFRMAQPPPSQPNI